MEPRGGLLLRHPQEALWTTGSRGASTPSQWVSDSSDIVHPLVIRWSTFSLHTMHLPPFLLHTLF